MLGWSVFCGVLGVLPMGLPLFDGRLLGLAPVIVAAVGLGTA